METRPVVHADQAPASEVAAGVALAPMIEPQAGSPLALALLRVATGATAAVAGGEDDLLLYVLEGRGRTAVDGAAVEVGPGTALLVPAGDALDLTAAEALTVARFAAGGDADLHAPLGQPTRVAQLDLAGADDATGSRSFQIMLGPDNGCCRATMFVGVVPPGAAPWHFHQYDEIVMVVRGRARYHQVTGTPQEMAVGSAVRIRPRDVHVNENPADEELHVLGVFTPAGSPSAAYLAPAGSTPPHPREG